MKDKRYINILLPIPIEGTLTYELPDNFSVPQKGCRILVPLGERKTPVIGINYGEFTGELEGSANFKIKPILDLLDKTPLISQVLIQFIEWASKYYCYPLGLAFEEAMPSQIFSAKNNAIKKIINNLEKTKKKKESNLNFLKWNEKANILTEEQKTCLDAVENALLKNLFTPFLLFGVTGSGKTEVYLNAVRKCLEMGKSVLVLVPEIAMTSQIVSRFMNRFTDVSVYHSALTNAQRLNSWEKARTGEARIIIGTRSAIWMPIRDLGLIIIDEEHDPSYKQDTGFKYNARDLAIVRAQMERAVVLLGSATPSVVSHYHSLSGKYRLLTLTKRIGKWGFPEVKVVDKRDKAVKNPNYPNWLSETMGENISDTLNRGEQVLIFLNKRGFSTYIFCDDCGYLFTCSNCSVTYTWHKWNYRRKEERFKDGVLKCHYCGDEKPSLSLCPRCKSPTIKATGFGTERLMADLSNVFPNAKIDRLDRDNITTKNKLENILDSFRKGEIDILIGTQMVTKGHDFPNLTLVCIVMADFSFNVPEFNASEKAFQLISQVAGRAGRAEKMGKVIIQTYNPDNPIINYAINQDYTQFYEYEILKREKYQYPPFERLVLVLFSGTNNNKVQNVAFEALSIIEEVKKIEEFNEKITILGPSPCPIWKIEKKHRWQIMLKIKKGNHFLKITSILYENLSKLKKGNVRIEFDVDPISLL